MGEVFDAFSIALLCYVHILFLIKGLTWTNLPLSPDLRASNNIIK